MKNVVLIFLLVSFSPKWASHVCELIIASVYTAWNIDNKCGSLELQDMERGPYNKHSVNGWYQFTNKISCPGPGPDGSGTSNYYLLFN